MNTPRIPRVVGFVGLLSTLLSPVTAQTPWLQYTFSQGDSSAVIEDVSGHQRHGSLLTGTSLGTPADTADPACNNTASTMGQTGGGVHHAVETGTSAFKSFTVSMWFKADATLAQATRLFEFTGISGDALLLAVSSAPSANTIAKLALISDGNTLVESDGTHPAITSLLGGSGTWVFVAVTYNGTKTDLYVGSETMPVALAKSMNTSVNPWTGGNTAANFHFGNRGSKDRAFDGWLDDIRIYGDSLTTAAALSLSQLRMIQAERNLLLHYNFNNLTLGGSTAVPDLSGHSAHGVLSSSSLLGVPASGTTNDDTLKPGIDRGLAITASTTQMSGPGGKLTRTGGFGPLKSFTVTLWYKTDGAQSVKGATRLLDNGAQLFAFDGLNTAESGKFIFISNGTTVLTNEVENTTLKTQNKWVFVALTYDGSQTTNNVHLYTTLFEGVLTKIKTATFAPTEGVINWGDTLTQLVFGNNQGGTRALDGWMDNIRFFGHPTAGAAALSQTVLQEIAIADCSTPEPETVSPAIWAGHPVDFALHTHLPTNRQYVAFYNQHRAMTVMSRTLGSQTWTTKVLPSVIGWDTHNYITLTVDSANHLHVIGNLHNSPLAGQNTNRFYFRTETAGDIGTLTDRTMVGTDETKVTYPQFIKKEDGTLFFTYRNGESGSGATFLNKYDSVTRTWTRVSKLFDGVVPNTTSNSAYPVGPIWKPAASGSPGKWHMTWVWRETPSADTNHDLCYAWSEDLITWKTISGVPISLPITINTQATLPSIVVDPIPVGGGILNGSGRIGFDAAGKVVIAYHKYNDYGNTGAPTWIYLKRPATGGGWTTSCVTSDWNSRWDLGATGSLPVNFGHGAVRHESALGLFLSMWNPDTGGTWVINPTTLARTTTQLQAHQLPTYIHPDFVSRKRPEATMGVRRMEDSGTPPAGLRYVLRWETLPVNHDLAASAIPAPGELQILTLKSYGN
jgi:hypothetical protein